MSTIHQGYGDLAARIAISNLQKQTSSSFVEVMRMEHDYINPKTKEPSPLISEEVFNIIVQNAEKLEVHCQGSMQADKIAAGYSLRSRFQLRLLWFPHT